MSLIEEESERDILLTRIEEALRTDHWSELPKEIKSIKDEFSCYGKLIMRGDRIVIPTTLQSQIVKTAHIGHQGATSMKCLLRSRVWFPGMVLFIPTVSSVTGWAGINVFLYS